MILGSRGEASTIPPSLKGTVHTVCVTAYEVKICLEKSIGGGGGGGREDDNDGWRVT